MKITEQEIKLAAEAHKDNLQWTGISKSILMYKQVSFEQGAQWAISQMQPEWVACKYGDYIPNGHYVFRLNNNCIESNKSMYVDEEQVDFYFATGYIHIELPPKDIK